MYQSSREQHADYLAARREGPLPPKANLLTTTKNNDNKANSKRKRDADKQSKETKPRKNNNKTAAATAAAAAAAEPLPALPADVRYDEQLQCFFKHVKRTDVTYTRRAYPLDPGEESDSEEEDDDMQREPEVYVTARHVSVCV